MKNMTVRMIADTAVGAALCVLLILIAFYVPFIAVFAAFVCGIPLMYLCCKHNAVSGVMAFVSAIGVSFVLTGNILSTLMTGISYALPALVFGICLSKNTKFSISVGAAAAAALIGTVLELVMINGGGEGLRNMLMAVSTDMQTVLNESVAQSGVVLDTDVSGMLSSVLSQAVDMLMLYVPTIIIAIAVLYAYVISMFGVFVLKRLRVGNIQYIKFNMMRAPKIICIATIVLFLISSVAKQGSVYSAAIGNLALLSEIAVGICGFSFVDNLFSRKIKSGYIRTVVYASVWFVAFLIIPLVLEIFVIIGYADSWLGFPRSVNGGDTQNENQ